MGRYSQAGRALVIDTPLGPDALLLEKLTGSEAISELFSFQLELLAEIGTKIEFDLLLGQKVTITLAPPDSPRRVLIGLIRSLTEGPRVAGPDGNPTFVRYRAELVPDLWLLTRRVQSRIFQDQTVWQILETILRDEWQLPVKLQKSNLNARNFCVQYRESDFAFISRLMEEEGIYYYFVPTDAGDLQMIVTDGATSLPEVSPPDPVVYAEGGDAQRGRCRVYDWEKTQEVRSCKLTLRDYHFEMPASTLEAQESKLVPDQVKVGRESHSLNHQRRVNHVDLLEVYDFPGGYARYLDGIGRGGNDQHAVLQKLFDEAPRIAKIRREEEVAQCLTIRGRGDCAHFLPGHSFKLVKHFSAEAGAALVHQITRVEHRVSLEGAYTTKDEVDLVYENRFECIPDGVPYRPRRLTPRPRIEGTQTAVVVGPAGQEIALDPFGRVKVQFRWDRQGKRDQDSSCWIRVAQIWAGKNWGAFFWPRVGHEVVVTFEDGNPDCPLVIGSVYNAENMPPLTLPEDSKLTGFKSCIFGGDPSVNFNAIVFHDTQGQQFVQIHSQQTEMHNAAVNSVDFTPRAHYEFNGSLF